jgi:hypothetical protein
VTWALVVMWTTLGGVGLWIMTLFQHFWSNPILFEPQSYAIGNDILSSFCAYVEHPNPISYAFCTSI